MRIRPVRLTSYWELQSIGWICFYAWSLLGSLPEILSRREAFRELAILMGLLFLGTCVLHPICRWLLRSYPSLLAFEWRAFVASAVYGAAAAFVNELIINGIHNMNSVNLVQNSVQFPFVLFLWCSLYFSIKQWQQSAQERERLLRAEAETREARLRTLRYQLNPHFLFNSLNAVSTLVLDGNAPAATRMLAQIGDFLRTSLTNDAALEVPLSQEMAFTQQYIGIEETRLGERLQISVAIRPDTLDAMVPSMLLQPLVENAVRHGIANLAEGGKVTIECGLREGRLRIMVRNSGLYGARSQRETGNGIGQSNISQRLATLYGPDHTYLLTWPASGGCEVVVELPFRRMSGQTT